MSRVLREPALDVFLQQARRGREANGIVPTKPPYKSARYPQLLFLFRSICVFNTFGPQSRDFQKSFDAKSATIAYLSERKWLFWGTEGPLRLRVKQTKATAFQCFLIHSVSQSKLTEGLSDDIVACISLKCSVAEVRGVCLRVLHHGSD
jgi:hypothetical protein